MFLCLPVCPGKLKIGVCVQMYVAPVVDIQISSSNQIKIAHFDL